MREPKVGPWLYFFSNLTIKGKKKMKIYLQVIIKFCSLAGFQSRRASDREKRWGRLECLLARKTTVHSREVDIPRNMDRFWVLFPVTIHLVDVIRVGSVSEGIVGRRRSSRRKAARRRSRESTRRALQATEGLPAQHGRR